MPQDEQTGTLPPMTDEVVVVIDVIRAFTTAVILASKGATEILCVKDAREAATTSHHAGARSRLVVGEQLHPPFPVVDLPNSPCAALVADVDGRPVTLFTVNGTPAAASAPSGATIVCSAVINASATAAWIRTNHPDASVHLLVTDHRTPEDQLCADLLTALLTGIPTNRAAIRAGIISAIDAHALLWREHVAEAYWHRFVADVHLCAEPDIMPVVLHGRQEAGYVRLLPIVPGVLSLGGVRQPAHSVRSTAE